MISTPVIRLKRCVLAALALAGFLLMPRAVADAVDGAVDGVAVENQAISNSLRPLDAVPDWEFKALDGSTFKARDSLAQNAVLLLLLPPETADARAKTPAPWLEAFFKAAAALRAVGTLPVALVDAGAASELKKGGAKGQRWPQLVVGGDFEKFAALFRVPGEQANLIFIDAAGFWRRSETVRSVAALSSALKRAGKWAPTLQTGQIAPDFSVPLGNGRVFRLGDYRGQKNVLLTFFPKCFTGGCTNHLTSLRDRQAIFDEAETEILAVSVDPADGPRGGRAFAERWGFEFPLVPDTGRHLSMLYGAALSPDDVAARMSVLIDKNGVVRWITRAVRVHAHGDDVLDMMRELKLNP